MLHAALVTFSGLRIREPELLALGMRLPGLQTRAQAIAHMPSLGLLTLAGMMPENWTCSYHESDGIDDEYITRILDTAPDLIAVSALSASIAEAYAFAQRIKGSGVGVPLIIGGLHATACPEEAGMYFDAVVIGDGESVWPELLGDIENDTLKPRYQSPGTFDLNDAPIPRFDLLGLGQRNRLTLQTQRGCPFSCEFCAASRLLGRFREKPVANIDRELEALCSLVPSPMIELADDNTFAGGRDVEPLLETFARHDVRYFTEADWRIGERPELLARLAKSGCVQVLIGFESLAFQYEGMGAKLTSLTRMMEAAIAIQDAGVAVIGCFIVGGDGETRHSIDQLATFIHNSPLAEIQITLQTPFPGSPLYQRLKSEGRLLPDRGWESCTLFDLMFEPDCMSVAELEQAFHKLLSVVFSNEENLRRQRIRRSIWRQRERSLACPSKRFSVS